MKHEQHYLDTEVAPIDVVSEEEISRLCRVSSHLEQLHQVKVLAVHVTTHGDGCIHLEKIWLLREQLCPFLYDECCLLLCEPAFTVEMLLEELDVRLRSILRGEELFIGRCIDRWGLDIWDIC